MKVKITLPDGSIKEFPQGTTALQVAGELGRRLQKDTLAALLNGKLTDATQPIEKDAELSIITKTSPEGLEILRHSTAHLLAHAVKELYPETQITIGPVTEDGFYYDFSREEKFAPQDLEKIEERMKQIASKDFSVERKVWDRNEASKFFESMGEQYKSEIIASLPDAQVTTYQQGEFIDLCRGPHVPSTGKLGHFKLLSIAGAYWRGDENNEMLQRIYGTAFPTEKALKEHLNNLEEAKRRDHRKLGPEMDLFRFLPVAPAMPFFQPKGTLLYNSLLAYVRSEMKEAGYHEVSCPQLMSAELWKTSGHWDHYQENMFVVGDASKAEQDLLALKPMNCPGHVALFKAQKHSYRELPLRVAEFTKVHRNERAGVTHGLFRTRTFSIDDGHIFCAEEDVGIEAQKTIEHTLRIYQAVGFENVEIKLATRPESFLGTPEIWDRAEQSLKESLEKSGQEFEIEEGEGAFYGPKIEFHVKDSLNRRWQCGTVQLDFNLPGRFELEYTDKDGQSKTPAMIHRAILGSFERFLGILIEHHAGRVPMWLAPVQLKILTLTSDQEKYAKELGSELKRWGVRYELDLRGEKLGYKIREAQLQRIPVMLIIGKQEAETNTVSVRWQGREQQQAVSMEDLERQLKPELEPKSETGGRSHQKT